MPKKPPIARISITIPADALELADQLADKLDRSRSWVMSEAVRQMARTSPHSTVREPVVNPYAGHEAEMETARLRRLKADLTTTPEQRLRDAEELVRLGRMVRPSRSRSQIIGFDSYEDYDRWKTTQHARG
jgi:predicted transcriptional regulator